MPRLMMAMDQALRQLENTECPPNTLPLQTILNTCAVLIVWNNFFLYSLVVELCINNKCII